MSCTNIVDLCAIQGDDEDYPMAFTIGKGDDAAPYNLTGCTIKFIIGELKDTLEADALIVKTITVFDDAVNGKATLSLSSTDTEQPLGVYFYRLRIINASIKKKTIMRGTLKIAWAK